MLSVSPSTPDFVSEAAIGGMFEIQSSQLAKQKASAAEQTFAERMTEDHTKASNKLKSLVQNGSVKANLPTALDDATQKKLDQLKSLSGAEFNKTYADDQISVPLTCLNATPKGATTSFSSNGSPQRFRLEGAICRWRRIWGRTAWRRYNAGLIRALGQLNWAAPERRLDDASAASGVRRSVPLEWHDAGLAEQRVDYLWRCGVRTAANNKNLERQLAAAAWPCQKEHRFRQS
jgi:predicted outer membrane protein